MTEINLESVATRLDEQERLLQKLVSLVEKALEAKPAPDAALTVGQVAERLGVSTWTVRSLDRCGKLPAARIGKGRGTLRFNPADVQRYERQAAGCALPKTTDARRRELLKL